MAISSNFQKLRYLAIKSQESRKKPWAFGSIHYLCSSALNLQFYPLWQPSNTDFRARLGKMGEPK